MKPDSLAERTSTALIDAQHLGMSKSTAPAAFAVKWKAIDGGREAKMDETSVGTRTATFVVVPNASGCRIRQASPSQALASVAMIVPNLSCCSRCRSVKGSSKSLQK